MNDHEPQGYRAARRRSEMLQENWDREGGYRPGPANPFAGYGWIVPVAILVGVILAIVAQAPR